MIMESKNWRNLFGLIGEKKSVPAVGSIGEQTRSGLQKAYIPNFLYKPPFGYPRFVDLVNIRRLAAMPYVDMCITTIIDELCAVEWDIVAKEGKEDSSTYEEHKKQVIEFYENPNTNKESFEEIRRKYLRDILEVDAGVINKIFNQGEEMVEIVARDGATFTKNPDIYGMFTDRDDIIIDSQILPPNKEASAMAVEPGFITAADARERAAYFQYGWISGARPVPFGRKEIVWFERNGRTDSIYGRSPVQVLADTIQTLIYAIEHNLEYFNENSIPKGVIGLDGSDAEEIEAFQEQWAEQQLKKDSAGNWKKDFHKLPIVGRTPSFTRFQFTNQELELLEGQKWWAKLVWACFGVTSVELGYTEDSKGLANQIVQSNVFKKRSLYPILRLEEYRHNQEIISEFEFDDVEFKFILFDVEEEMKKAQLYQTQLSAGYVSVNEVRTEEGMEEVEWGEKKSQEEMMEMNQKYGNNFENSNKVQGPMGKEEDDQRAKTKKDKENLTGEKKAIPINENPLILKEGETLDDKKLEKAMVYLLRQNEKKLKDLIKKEVGENKLKEVKAIDELVKAIKSLLTFEGLRRISDAVINQTFMKGWDNAERQLDKNFIINKHAIEYIKEYTFENIKNMSEEIANDLRAELQRGLMEGEGVDKLTGRVKSVFGKSETRAEAIARTETTRAENQGKLQAFKSSGEKFKKKWVAAMDERTSPVCQRLNGQVVDMDKNFKDAKSGWEGPCPPSHVNCRSSVVFLNPEDESRKGN